MTEERRLSEAESVKSATREPFIIEIISAVDIPCLESKAKCDPYIQAVVGCPNEGQLTLFQYQKIGATVRTPVRSDSSSVVYNSYRDLNVKPSTECVLMVELFHASKDPHKPDILMGKVDIPLKAFTNEDPVTFPFINFKSGLQGKNPDFAVTIRRAFINKAPPLYRTFFIIRHGQSKWNRALSRINITGMLDRDHALTTEGIKQALTLNARWRQELLQDTNYNSMHTADSTLMVPEMFDFSRMDENETLELDEEHSSDDGSDSDNETSAAVTPAVAGHGTSPVPGSGKGNGFSKLYDSFFMKRPSVTTGQPAETGGTTSVPMSSPKQAMSDKSPGGDGIDLSDMDVQQLNHSTHSTQSNHSDVPSTKNNTAANSNAASSSSVLEGIASPAAPLPTTPVAKPSRRNTYIYSSDSPSPRTSPTAQVENVCGCTELNGLGSSSAEKSPDHASHDHHHNHHHGHHHHHHHQPHERFSSFDETFPPPEPMVNPFESDTLPIVPVDPNHRPNVLELVQTIMPTALGALPPAAPLSPSAAVEPAAPVNTAEGLVVPHLLPELTPEEEALFTTAHFVAALPPIEEGLSSEEAASNEATLEGFPTLETDAEVTTPVAYDNPFDAFPVQEVVVPIENPFDALTPAKPTVLEEGARPVSVPLVAPASTPVDPFEELCATMDTPQNFATSIVPDIIHDTIHENDLESHLQFEVTQAPVLTPVPSTAAELDLLGTPVSAKKSSQPYDPFEDFPTSPVGDLLDVDLPPFDPSAAQTGFEVDFMNRSMNLLNGEPAESEADDAAGAAMECSSTQSQEDADEESEASEDDDDLPQRREEYIRLFMRADVVYSSPLTRALQTALAAMCGHTALAKNKLIMYRAIREIKRIGGLDTVGIECGAGIMKRVKQELQQSLGANKAEELVDSVGVDYSSAEAPWWTNISSFDNEKDQLERIREFLTFSRYCPHTIPVFVGHSLFFRAFYSKRISKVMDRKRPNLSDNMKRFKLSNATLMAVTVKYTDLEGGASDALILDADILFGGGFHGARHVKAHHHDGADSHNEGLASSLTLSETDIDGSLQLKEPDNIHKLASSIQQSITSSAENLKSGKDAISKGVSIISSSISELF